VNGYVAFITQQTTHMHKYYAQKNGKVYYAIKSRDTRRTTYNTANYPNIS